MLRHEGKARHVSEPTYRATCSHGARPDSHMIGAVITHDIPQEG